jgi:putative nucleotidyltransferase with HDIG domain
MHQDVREVVNIIGSMREQFNHHGPRVSGNAVKLAEAVGMSRYDIGMIAAGAQLHDIGKLLIRPELLNAPRALTEDERAEINTHVVMGWDIVNQAGYEKTIQDIVRHHHEKWDGTGYPDGLKQTDIPIAARIVAVCDIYQAMTDDRIYRDAVTPEFAKEYMLSSKGIILDPQLVDLFFEKVVTE